MSSLKLWIPQQSDNVRQRQCSNCGWNDSLLQCTGTDEKMCHTRICYQSVDDPEGNLRCLELCTPGQALTLSKYNEEKAVWKCPGCWKGRGPYPHRIRPATRRYDTHLGESCRHDVGICKSVRIVVIYTSECREQANGYAKLLVSLWMGHGWKYHLVLLELEDTLPVKGVYNDEKAFESDQECTTYFVLVFPSVSLEDTMICLPGGRVWNNVSQCIADILPQSVAQIVERSHAWHAVLCCNVYKYFQGKEALQRRNAVINSIKTSRMKSLVLVFTEGAEWRPGWTSSMVGGSLPLIVAGGYDVFETYKRNWLSNPAGHDRFNIAIVTQDQGIELRNITGYKVIADANVNPGRFGFRIVHVSAKPHFFSEEQAVVREWMKVLMKATLLRNYNEPSL
ncbi:hypothetical protein RSOLAG1IB_11500 [Rhizoctonia solani AG-1 IB]|uniref:Uncharacterized protein n=1 Tax=Thanatephorus cucumeris (strain AG1-IB / isolate 7/3/14) TaxID=1108050 RepID=A0A0B7FC03_THACB|nr:hypothetical protein RSOLAG1IB_11500 [Rhizoctonia solani AG-1 IB]